MLDAVEAWASLKSDALCRWETGYWGTMDIAHDRAGYYLCWGCLNWVPAIYTSPALYITEHPIEWSLPAAVLIGVAGAAAIYINYDSDRQRQVKRQPVPVCLSALYEVQCLLHVHL